MAGKYIFLYLLLISIILLSCKKDETNLEKDIVGTWDVLYFITVEYDTLDNIIYSDTSIWVDTAGNPVKFSEKYTEDNNYSFFEQSKEQLPLLTSTYTLEGNILTIKKEETFFLPHERIITKLTPSSLEETYTTDWGNNKIKLVQQYVRRK